MHGLVVCLILGFVVGAAEYILKWASPAITSFSTDTGAEVGGLWRIRWLERAFGSCVKLFVTTEMPLEQLFVTPYWRVERFRTRTHELPGGWMCHRVRARPDATYHLRIPAHTAAKLSRKVDT